MFSNPFTPESQKAKKSLLKQESKDLKLGLLSKKIENKIDDFERKVAFGPFEIKKSQVEFLKDLIEAVMEGASYAMEDIDHYQAEEKIINELKRSGKIDKAGNIIELTLNLLFVPRIPPTIKNLKNLKVLRAENLQLIELPEELWDCTELRVLYLDENELTHISDKIAQLKKLKDLNLGSNDLLIFSTKAQLKKLLPNTIITFPKGL